MLPVEEPDNPKKRPFDPTEKFEAPRSDPEPTPPEVIEYEERLAETPNLIAQYADDIARGLIGGVWDSPHRIFAFGASTSVAVQVFENRETADARLLRTELKEVASSIFMEAARTKRPLVCIISLSGVLAATPRTLTADERRSQVLAHRAAALLVKDRFYRRELEDAREPLLELLAELSQPGFRPRCHVVTDVALASGGGVPKRFKAASGQTWYLVSPLEARALVACASEILRRRESEFLLQLTSFPKGCEPWLVGEKSHAERLHEALDRALEGLSMPAAEKPLAEVSGPADGVAIAHSVWQSLRAEMKEVIEARIRELSLQRFETFEEKAAVAAELHQAMMEWGFRAVSPSSGHPSALRCRQTAKNPRGFFYLQDIVGSDPVEAPDPEAPRASASLPVFTLTDPPQTESSRKENA